MGVPHDHREFMDWCFRCHLSRDEAQVPAHECDSGIFDRVLCPGPCGAMHTYCSVCDELQDECRLGEEA